MKEEKTYTPEEEIRRAGEAKGVIHSRIFTEARDHVREVLIEKMKAVGAGNTAAHTQLILMFQAWSALEGWLEQTAETGKMAELQLIQAAQQEDQKKRFALFGR